MLSCRRNRCGSPKRSGTARHSLCRKDRTSSSGMRRAHIQAYPRITHQTLTGNCWLHMKENPQMQILPKCWRPCCVCNSVSSWHMAIIHHDKSKGIRCLISDPDMGSSQMIANSKCDGLLCIKAGLLSNIGKIGSMQVWSSA